MSNNSRAAKATKIGYISRDEMNLAEFPLTVLSTRSNPKIKTLEFNDTIYNKQGKPVNRRWIITGTDKFGLPTASDDEVLLGLLKLTVDSGFEDRKIHFTRYELLRVLRWTTEGRSYRRLQNALDRLSGVRVKATNAFFDNESKAHSTRNFGIIDAYEINDGRDLSHKPSFFVWSEVMFKSFQVGFIKKLDLDYYLDLQSAVSRRLFRYLDKHFWYKARLNINLFTLAHEKLGISRNYRYPSSLRQQLDPAIDELIATGFISGANYEGKGKDTQVVFSAARKKPRSVESSEARSLNGQSSNGQGSQLQGRSTGSSEYSSAESCAAENSGAKIISFPTGIAAGGEGEATRRSDGTQLELLVADKLTDRGLQDRQVQRLLSEKSGAELERIEKIIDYYDALAGQGSHLISRSPIGFLYKAVEKCNAFVLPGEKAQTSLDLGATKGREKNPTQQRRKSPGGVDSGRDREGEFLTFRNRELGRLKQTVEPELLHKITQDVEQALVKMKAVISAEGYAAAVDHGVKEKLAGLFKVPDFTEWLEMN